MTDSISETLAAGVAITVVAVVVLRLMAATYFLWKEDRERLLKLDALLNDELTRDDRAERTAARSHAIKLRTELGAALAETIVLAELHAKPELVRNYDAYIRKNGAKSFLKCRELINALSYDVPLRISAYKLSVLAAIIVHKGAAGEDTTKEEIALYELRKIVFRLIHKVDKSREAELISSLEAQNLFPGEEDQPDGQSEEIDALNKIREAIKDPDLLAALRRQIEPGSSDRL